MTKKNPNQTSLVRTGSSAVAPYPQVNGNLTKTQKDVVEQTDTHLLKMAGVTQKALYAAHCLHTVHDATIATTTMRRRMRLPRSITPGAGDGPSRAGGNVQCLQP